MNITYTSSLKQHYEGYFGTLGKRLDLGVDPHKKLHPDFYILEFGLNHKHDFWVYCTVGMALGMDEENLIELFIFSPKKDESLVELLTVVVSYHQNDTPLNLHHTFNIGRAWLDNSKCEYGFISLPYLDGPELEIFNYKEDYIHCYWVIPITESEREFKMENGCDALENLFENKGIGYLDPDREPLV